MSIRPLLCAPLFLASCAGLEVTDTGFLERYEQLERAPLHEVAFIPDEVLFYENEEADWSRFASVHVEPVVFRPVEQLSSEVTEEEANKLTAKFGEYLRERFAKTLEVVEEPRDDSLVIRAAITDLDRSIVWVNIVGIILAVPVDYGGIAGELEIVDASGERMIAMAAHRDGTMFLVIECFTKWGHARHGMKKWAKLLARSVDEARAESLAR